MFILQFLIAALISTAIASPIAGEFIGLANDDHLSSSSSSSSDDFSVNNGFWQSAEMYQKEINLRFMMNDDKEEEKEEEEGEGEGEAEEALITWQDLPADNLISTDATLPEKSIPSYSTKFVIAGGAGEPKVEKEVQIPPVDLDHQGERFQKFDCGNANGVCCMGNPLVTNRVAQRCEQSNFQLCSYVSPSQSS